MATFRGGNCQIGFCLPYDKGYTLRESWPLFRRGRKQEVTKVVFLANMAENLSKEPRPVKGKIENDCLNIPIVLMFAVIMIN